MKVTTHLLLLAALAPLVSATSRSLLSTRRTAFRPRNLIFGQTGVSCQVPSCSAAYPAAAPIANCISQATLGKRIVTGECLRRDGGQCDDMGNNCNGCSCSIGK